MTDVVPMARELTQEEFEQRAAECARLDAHVKQALAAGREALWDLARALYEFREASAWTMLGYESLGEYLADPDVTMTWRTFDRLVRGWRELAVNRHLDSPTLAKLDPSKADIALPALTTGQTTVDEFVADVEVLPARDLRIKYRQIPEPMPEPVDDGDVVDEIPEVELGPLVVDDDPLEQVPRGVAQTLTLVLENVLALYGNPKRKTISAEMRAQIEYALALGHEHGLGGPHV